MPRTAKFAVNFRRFTCAAAVLGLGVSSQALALEFEFGEQTFRVDNLITIGTMMRMQKRDPSLVGKTNLNPGLCFRRTSQDSESGPVPNPEDGDNSYSTGIIPSNCAVSVPAANQAFVNAQGSYNVAGDDGNLSFDKGDLVHATAKITTDVNANIFDFNIFVRGLYFYDGIYTNLDLERRDTTLQARNNPVNPKIEEILGTDFQVLDYFVSRTFELGDRNIAVKLGNQVLNWGESAFLIPNSLNSINPPNQALLRIPGFDIKELFQPVGMLFVSGDLFSGVSLEGFYQYEWKGVVADPPGSFFSQSDLLGDGGRYAQLGLGKAPEDPGFATDDPRYPAGFRGTYRPIDTCSGPGMCTDSLGLFGSTASRTAYRDYNEEARRAPEDGGQYGFALKYFADWLNGGTELGLYYANYHSRFPVVSVFATEETCLETAAHLVLPAALGGCGAIPGSGLPAEREPIPVDTIRFVVEYPENIKMYGVSFNTTVGDWALAGEYTYRPNLPIQIHTTDLGFAAFQPAFPEDDINLGAAVVPGRRSAVPDFVMTNYRGTPPVAGQYIQGFERMKQGQADVTLLKTFGGDNPLNASQIAVLLEMGHTYVFDFPELSELQFQGAGTDTHISGGGDGTPGINPRDIRSNPDDPASTSIPSNLRSANPTAHADHDGFGSESSYGYRLVTLTRYDSAFFGVNLEFLNAFFHDIEGTGPGIGQNFVEGRKQILSGIRWDYLSKYNGELRYTWFTGAAKRDQLRDRDNLILWLGYQF